MNKEGALKLHIQNQNVVFEASGCLTLHCSISCMWIPPYQVRWMEFSCQNSDVGGITFRRLLQSMGKS